MKRSNSGSSWVVQVNWLEVNSCFSCRKLKEEKSPKLQSFKGKISMNKFSKEKFPWTYLHKRKNHLSFKFSKDKSPWPHLHKRKNLHEQIFKGKISWTNHQGINLLFKISKEKSPWTNLHEKGKIPWRNHQRTNLHEHFFLKMKNLLNKSSKDKSPWTNFKK